MKDVIEQYGFVEVGDISAPDKNSFLITLSDADAAAWEKVIYIFLFNNEVKRIGSSKGRLGKRFNAWNRDVTKAIRRYRGIEECKTPTPEHEAVGWLALFEKYGRGEVYARIATEVETPIGKFRAYMDEESILINRFKPPMNRHTNR